jgi:dipeptidyl aminopeptidase/acylaminoacyl peptidase
MTFPVDRPARACQGRTCPWPAPRARAGLRRVTLANALLALPLLWRPLAAQGADLTLAYLAGTDTIGVEHVTVSATTWVGDLQMRGQPRLRWTQRLGEAPGLRTLDIEAWRPGAGGDDAPMQRLTLQVRGDSAYVHARAPGNTPLGPAAARVPARAGAAWLVNQSLAQAAWLVQASAARAPTTDTVWIVLASGAQLLPARLAREGATRTLEIAGVRSVFHIAADGTPDSVLVPAQRVRVVALRGAAAEAARAALSTPVSYDAPPDAPYTAEHVRVPTPMGHVLAATLTHPRTAAGRLPAVITISGSGAQERDEALPGVEGYRPFREIADTLGRRGIAVLRFDDRGTGESTGDHAAATSRDFARDVVALVAWLRARPDIDPDRIALLGHSEGGLIAPLVAAEDPRLAGIALLAGPAYTGARIIDFQQRSAIRQSYPDAGAAARDSMLRVAQQQLDSTAGRSPWITEFLTYDPLPTARRVRDVPVLILQGETDLQVTAEQADLLGGAFRDAGNRDVSVHRLANTNHLFQHDPSGLPSGYATLPDRTLTRETLGLVAEWLASRLGR